MCRGETNPFWEGELGVGSDVHGVGGLLLCRFLLQPPMRRCVQIVEPAPTVRRDRKDAALSRVFPTACSSLYQLSIAPALLHNHHRERGTSPGPHLHCWPSNRASTAWPVGASILFLEARR